MEYQGGYFGVGAGPVGLAVVEAEMVGKGGEVVLGNSGQEYGSQVPGVVVPIRERQMMGLEKTEVEGDVVADDWQVADEVRKVVGDLVERGGAFDLGRADRRELLDEGGNPASRVDESLIAVQDLAAPEPDRAEFDDGIGVGVEPSSLKVDGHELMLKRVEPRCAENGWLSHDWPREGYEERRR